MKCCTSLRARFFAPAESLVGEMADFYRTRGCVVSVEGLTITADIPSPCVHLTSEGCDIYDTRPRNCREFDGRKIDNLDCLWDETD
jgi:Fe-S-cluster containining protein